MKRDVKLWAAIILLICLTLYLIFISAKAGESRQRQIDGLRVNVHSIERIIKDSVQTTHNGKDGYTPVKGIDYFDGKDGKSIVGPKGDTGAAGQNGESAYDIWVSRGNTGTPADFLESLKGDTGARGPALNLRCFSGILQTKYSSDTFWKDSDIVCEVKL